MNAVWLLFLLGSELPAVFLLEEQEPGVLCREFPADAGALIGASVVDQKAFPVGEALRGHAAKAAGEKTFRPINGDYDAYRGQMDHLLCMGKTERGKNKCTL